METSGQIKDIFLEKEVAMATDGFDVNNKTNRELQIDGSRLPV